MPEEELRYDRMVERALRGVVYDALSLVASRGLPGDHHFYITFATTFPGVEIPRFLHDRYPREMTIVLQYQFFGLDVSREEFAVTLSFGGKHERLHIPLAAITTFADPSVNFALQFQTVEDAGDDLLDEADLAAFPAPEADVDNDPDGPDPDAPDAADEGAADGAGGGDRRTDGGTDGGKVVTLDNFRKK